METAAHSRSGYGGIRARMAESAHARARDEAPCSGARAYHPGRRLKNQNETGFTTGSTARAKTSSSAMQTNGAKKGTTRNGPSPWTSVCGCLSRAFPFIRARLRRARAGVAPAAEEDVEPAIPCEHSIDQAAALSDGLHGDAHGGVHGAAKLHAQAPFLLCGIALAPATALAQQQGRPGLQSPRQGSRTPCTARCPRGRSQEREAPGPLP